MIPVRAARTVLALTWLIALAGCARHAPAVRSTPSPARPFPPLGPVGRSMLTTPEETP